MKYKHFLLYLTLSLSGLPLYAQQLQPGDAKQDSSTQVIYLTFHIKKTAANPDGEIVLTGSKVFAGHLKQSNDTSISKGRKGQFMVSLKNGQGQTVCNSIIDNPLEEKAEYIKEGGELAEATITKTETDFTIRLPYYPGCGLGEIKKFKEDKTPVKISSLMLNSDK